MLSEIQAAQPQLSEAAAQADQQRQLPADTAELFRQQGWWKMWVPKQYGGRQLAMPEALRCFEAMAAIDGSIGWALTIGVGGGLFAAHLNEQAATTIYSPREALIAGSGAPSGTLTAAAEGYRANGLWHYCSGIHNASWVTANATLESGEMIAFAAPAESVEIIDSWQTMGLRGTGSHDIRLTDVAIDPDFTFTLDKPRIDAPLYRFPFEQIAQCSFAATALGIAKGALNAFQQQASAEKMPLAEPAEQRLEQISDRFYQLAEQCWQEQCQRGSLSELSGAQLSRLTRELVAEVTAAVDHLMMAGGMAAIYRDSRLGHAYRDLLTLRQHRLITPLLLAA